MKLLTIFVWTFPYDSKSPAPSRSVSSQLKASNGPVEGVATGCYSVINWLVLGCLICNALATSISLRVPNSLSMS